MLMYYIYKLEYSEMINIKCQILNSKKYLLFTHDQYLKTHL